MPTAPKTPEKTEEKAPMENSIPTPEAPAVTAQEAKTIGEVSSEDSYTVEPSTNQGEVAAQVMQPREADSDVVHVHEVMIATDRVITDPSSPLAVQIPEEGRGSLDLPMHRLGGGTVEDKFRAADAEAAKTKK
jgi:hypothetical protein